MTGNGTAVGSTGSAVGAPRVGAFMRAALGLLALGLLALAAAPAARAAECSNEARRSEQGSTALPDCRAYELVTPPGKDSGEPLGSLTTNKRERGRGGVAGARAALGGERFSWWSEYALPESALTHPYETGTPGLQYLSTRSAGGWTSENTIPSQSVEYGLACQQIVGMVGWSEELERGVLADSIPGKRRATKSGMGSRTSSCATAKAAPTTWST
jgi:hypothetical protein